MLIEGIATIRGEKGSVGLSGQGDGFAELRVTGRYIARARFKGFFLYFEE